VRVFYFNQLFPASQITVYDIYKAFEPELSVVPCLPDEGKCKRKNMCAAVHFWSGLNHYIKSYFESQSLRDLVDKQGKLNQSGKKTFQE